MVVVKNVSKIRVVVVGLSPNDIVYYTVVVADSRLEQNCQIDVCNHETRRYIKKSQFGNVPNQDRCFF